MRRTLTILTSVAVALATALPALAVSVNIVNADFEDPGNPDNSALTTLAPSVPGWDQLATNEQSGTTDHDGTAAGATFAGEDDYFFLNTTGASTAARVIQVLAETLQANTRYTLSVDVGWIDNTAVPSFPPVLDGDSYNGLNTGNSRVLARLVTTPDEGASEFNFGVLSPILVSSDAVAPAPGQVVTWTLVYETGPSPDHENDNLLIELFTENSPGEVGNGIEQVLFDDISLDATFIGPDELLGDYNGDLVVDAADYTVWRDSLGASITLPGEDPSVTPGMVTVEDYAVWKNQFGATAGSGAGSLSATGVPEPSSLLLLGLGGLAVAAAGRRAARQR